MLAYDQPLYRPPSEAKSFILQVTLGCSFNRCTFCSMYRSKEFQVRSRDDIFRDIDTASMAAPNTRRVFLADGDALVCDTAFLLEILQYLKVKFPSLSRVSSYALPANLIRKTTEELTELKQSGLTLLYFGLESGSAKVLKLIRKGAQPSMMEEGLIKAHDAGLKVSATVILGLAGARLAEEHIVGTVELVNRVPLTYLSTLQLGLDAIIRDEFLDRFGTQYVAQDDPGMLAEQVNLISGINPPKPVIFRSNHASNALPLAGNLPRDKDRLLATIDAAEQRGEIALVPKWFRGY